MRFAALTVLCLSLLLGACEDSSQKSAAPTVAVVDINRLMRDSEHGKNAQVFLENIQKEFSERLVSMNEKLQKNPDDAALTQEMQMLYMGLQQRMQAEGQNVESVLLEQILRTVKEYRQKAGLSAIIRSEAAMDFGKTLDCTDALLDMLNQQKLEFHPVTKDPAPAEVKAPEAAADKPAAAPAEEAAKAPAAASEAAPAAK